MDKVAVVILNWNGKKYLEKYLPSVLLHSNLSEVKIYVADNGSTDDSVSFLKTNFPTINIICIDANYGFAEGYNKALNKIEAKYFVLLNSDVEVTAQWLEPIIKKMDIDSTIAACMPKILSYHDKKMFEYAGAAGGFIDKLGYPFCRGRIINQIEEDLGQYNDEIDIFWATGACMFVRADLYKKAGGLDGDFFAHMEEIDLCWRFKNMGYRIVYNPHSVVYHVGGGTLPNNNPKKIYLNYRNNLFLLYKNLPTSKIVPTIFTRMVLDGLSALAYLSKFSFSFFWAVIKAHLDFYISIGHSRKKRQQNKLVFINYNHLEIYKKSIVYQFFINKLKTFDKLKF